jgi:hypothetical protein
MSDGLTWGVYVIDICHMSEAERISDRIPTLLDDHCPWFCLLVGLFCRHGLLGER